MQISLRSGSRAKTSATGAEAADSLPKSGRRRIHALSARETATGRRRGEPTRATTMSEISFQRLLKEWLILLNLCECRVAVDKRVSEKDQCLEGPHVQHLLMQYYDLVV